MDQLVKYDLTDAAIAEMKAQYMGFAIQGIDDKEGFEMVHEARMVVKGKRVAVEKRRKELKADALDWGRKVDSEAKKIFAKLAPIEDYLKSEENKVTEEKARIKAEEERKEQERIQGRIDTLLKYECSLPFFDVAAMSEDEFDAALEDAKIYFEANEIRKAKEEADRKEREEKERKEREEAEAKLKAEREELERIRKEQAEAAAKIEAEKKALEDEKRKVTEEEGRKKAEAEKSHYNKLKKKAQEARREALKPDKEKLISWIETIEAIVDPELDSDVAKAIHIASLDGIAQVFLATHRWINKEL
jgi:hypothetical protein